MTTDRNEVLEEIRRVAKLFGKDSVSRAEFARHGRVSLWQVYRKLGNWNAAVQAAGLAPDTSRARLTDAELEDEFRRVADALGRTPTRMEFAANSRFSPDVYRKRFGAWRKTVQHYLGVEATGAPPRERRQPPQPAGLAGRTMAAAHPVHAGKRGHRFGGLLNFRELRHEPTSELGVVYLFGMVARELGFLVDAVGAEFPDCRAKQLVKGGYYVEVDIEFEFKSSNFREHGHDPAQCDLIVCWQHDWPNCPLEVLELKSAIKGLDPNV